MWENWKDRVYGATRVFNNKHELKHHNGKIISFDSKEELDEYLQEYHFLSCELSGDVAQEFNNSHYSDIDDVQWSDGEFYKE